jgi:hypothetical protein
MYKQMLIDAKLITGKSGDRADREKSIREAQDRFGL